MTLIRTSIAALFALLSLAAGAIPAQQTAEITPTERPFLWRIDGPGKGYCYGTIHVPDERVTTMPKVVLDAIEASDEVYTELEFNSRMMATMTRAMILPRRQKLDDVLPEKLYERLTAYLEKKGLPLQMVQRQKIWAVVMTVVMLEFQKGGARGGQPLDMVVVREAKDRDKETGGLETVEEQLSVFESLSNEEQASMLAATIDALEKAEAEGENMAEKAITLYLDGDAEALMDYLNSFSMAGTDPALEEKFEKAILIDRNIRMADRIHEMYRKDPSKVRFFAVGTAHYPGEHGMLALLRDKGYRITRVGEKGGGDAAAMPAGIDAKIDALRKRVEELERRLEAIEKQRRKRAGAGR